MTRDLGCTAYALIGLTARQPAWWSNLLADPRATFVSGAISSTVKAREATGGERDRLWATANAAYPGHPRYERESGRAVPLVLLDPA